MQSADAAQIVWLPPHQRLQHRLPPHQRVQHRPPQKWRLTSCIIKGARLAKTCSTLSCRARLELAGPVMTVQSGSVHAMPGRT